MSGRGPFTQAVPFDKLSETMRWGMFAAASIIGRTP